MEETGEEGVGAVQVSKVRRKEGPMCFRARKKWRHLQQAGGT